MFKVGDKVIYTNPATNEEQEGIVRIPRPVPGFVCVAFNPTSDGYIVPIKRVRKA